MGNERPEKELSQMRHVGVKIQQAGPKATTIKAKASRVTKKKLEMEDQVKKGTRPKHYAKLLLSK